MRFVLWRQTHGEGGILNAEELIEKVTAWIGCSRETARAALREPRVEADTEFEGMDLLSLYATYGRNRAHAHAIIRRVAELLRDSP